MPLQPITKKRKTNQDELNDFVLAQQEYKHLQSQRENFQPNSLEYNNLTQKINSAVKDLNQRRSDNYLNPRFHQHTAIKQAKEAAAVPPAPPSGQKRIFDFWQLPTNSGNGKSPQPKQ